MPTSWLFAAALAMVAVSTILGLALGPVRGVEDQRALVGFASTAGLVALVAGVVSAAGEYRHHTIIPAVLLTPRRAQLVAAQAVAYAAGGAALGLAAAALSTLIVIVGVPIRGAQVGVPVVQIAVVAIGAVIYTALSAALGVGLGALARNQVAAVAGVLVLISLVDPAISALTPPPGRFGPSALGIAFSDSGAASNGPFSQILPLWAAAAGLVLGAILGVSRALSYEPPAWGYAVISALAGLAALAVAIEAFRKYGGPSR